MVMVYEAIPLLVALAWTVIALRMIFSGLAIRFVKPIHGDYTASTMPPVHIIIPAHNEEKNIETVVRTVMAQDYPAPFTVTVVDDRSIDNTHAILLRLKSEFPQLRVIAGTARPPGWVGKTWAVTQGANTITTGWILFVDADISLHPRALLSAMVRIRGADLLSFIPRPLITTFWQAGMAMTIGIITFLFHPFHKVNDVKCPEHALAAGGFILVRRTMYERVGGHGSVQAEILEDVTLARAFKWAGGKLSIHFAPELVTTRMYGGFFDLCGGLRKHTFAAADFRLAKFTAVAVSSVVLVWVPIIALAVGILRGDVLMILSAVWGTMAMVVAVAPTTHFLRISSWGVLSFPLGLTAYMIIGCTGVWDHYRGRVVWGDVTFNANELKAAKCMGERIRKREWMAKPEARLQEDITPRPDRDTPSS